MKRVNSLFKFVSIRQNYSIMYTRSQSKQYCNYAIVHDERLREFHMNVNNCTAKIEYNKCGEVLDLVESFVPEALRGKGLGRELAKGTFDYINENNLKIKVTCTFLQKFYEENKSKYKHLVVD